MKTRPRPLPRIALSLIGSTALALIASLGLAAPESEEPGRITDQDREEAKAHFLAGSKSFAKDNFRQAIVQFGKAFDLVRSPEILFNIGRCHEELGEFEEAIYHYEMYLRLSPEGADSEAVRERIASLREAEAKPADGSAEPAEAQPGQAEGAGQKTGRGTAKYAIRLGLDLGVGGGVSGPSEGVVVPIEVIAGFPVVRWLTVTAAFKYGHYFVDTSGKRRSGTSAYYSQNQVGGVVGLRGDWPVAEILSIMARLGFSALWIDFGHSEGKTCLAGRADGGIVVDVAEDWALFGALWVSAGAMLGKEIANTPLADNTPETEVGFAIGAEYIF